ncbi:Virginiamycin A acetyltransferase [Novipirellula artificiosorum]|uniref:Virginiamycin A acetyltransferase n=1 Tax=Novipirellula artificiosorum TaxID=2528016 RepID=A0A5C6CXH0_9BACT|nr:Virginiamycin A acetyltransferase [Novipirellula artificiosorum]
MRSTRQLQRLVDHFRLARFRKSQLRVGTTIDSGVSIFGITGLKLGKECVIGPNVTLAASHLQSFCRLETEPSGSITIGDRTVVHRGVIIATYGGEIAIGNDVSVNPYTILYGHGGLTIGSGTRIAAHCTVIPANHRFEDSKLPIYKQGLTTSGITIGCNVWVAANVTITDGVEIGDGAVIAAGAVVTRNVGSNQVVGGVPAQLIKRRSNSSSNRSTK